MNDEEIELLDENDSNVTEIKPIPNIKIEEEYLQPIPTVPIDTINSINEEIGKPKLINPEIVSESVGYSGTQKIETEEKNKKNNSKLITPEEVITQINEKTPQMISPEDVMQQVGNMRVPSQQKINEIDKQGSTSNINNSVKNKSTLNQISSTSVQNNIYLPHSNNYSTINEDEFEQYKKLNKDYRLTLLFIFAVTLFSIGIITSIVDTLAEKNKKISTKKLDDSVYIVENENGNSYFYSPLKNDKESGTSDDTTYYLLGDEQNGQAEIYNLLSKKYATSDTSNGQDDKSIEIGPIKDKKNIWIVLPLNYTNINERLIKSTNKDGSIIVIKNSKGITKKVEEQLRLMNQLGARKTIIFINQDDSSKSTDKIYKEIKKLLVSCGYDKNTPIITGKTDEDTVDELFQKIKEWADIVKSESEKDFRAQVVNISSKNNETKVELQILQGKINLGDNIKLLGEDYSSTAKISKISVNNKTKNKITMEDENSEIIITLNKKYDSSMKKIKVLETKNDISNEFNAVFYYSDDNNQPHRKFNINYSTEIQLNNSVNGNISIPKGINFLVKGDTSNISVILSNKEPIYVGQHFTINDQENNIFGYGEITDIVK